MEFDAVGELGLFGLGSVLVGHVLGSITKQRSQTPLNPIVENLKKIPKKNSSI
jgi:hypothetical protein